MLKKSERTPLFDKGIVDTRAEQKAEKQAEKKKAVRKRGIPKTGVWTRRTRRQFHAFLKAVRERDGGECQRAPFFKWLLKNHPARFYEVKLDEVWPWIDTIDVHHIFQKSTDRQLAFTTENGICLCRTAHQIIHDNGLEKLMQAWWLEVHPEYREVLGKP